MSKSETLRKNAIDLIGMRLGSYIIIDKANTEKKSGIYWLCECTECGRRAIKSSFNIRHGKVRNCNCQSERFVSLEKGKSITTAFKNKYGCNYCADLKKCRIENGRYNGLKCKYAEIIDPYGDFDNYLEETKETLDFGKLLDFMEG